MKMRNENIEKVRVEDRSEFRASLVVRASWLKSIVFKIRQPEFELCSALNLPRDFGKCS